jgi:hypothetical protein
MSEFFNPILFPDMRPMLSASVPVPRPPICAFHHAKLQRPPTMFNGTSTRVSIVNERFKKVAVGPVSVSSRLGKNLPTGSASCVLVDPGFDGSSTCLSSATPSIGNGPLQEQSKIPIIIAARSLAPCSGSDLRPQLDTIPCELADEGISEKISHISSTIPVSRAPSEILTHVTTREEENVQNQIDDVVTNTAATCPDVQSRSAIRDCVVRLSQLDDMSVKYRQMPSLEAAPLSLVTSPVFSDGEECRRMPQLAPAEVVSKKKRPKSNSASLVQDEGKKMKKTRTDCYIVDALSPKGKKDLSSFKKVTGVLSETPHSSSKQFAKPCDDESLLVEIHCEQPPPRFSPEPPSRNLTDIKIETVDDSSGYFFMGRAAGKFPKPRVLKTSGKPHNLVKLLARE